MGQKKSTPYIEHDGSMPQDTILSQYNPKQNKYTCNRYYQAF